LNDLGLVKEDISPKRGKQIERKDLWSEALKRKRREEERFKHKGASSGVKKPVDRKGRGKEKKNTKANLLWGKRGRLATKKKGGQTAPTGGRNTGGRLLRRRERGVHFEKTHS